MDNNAELLMRLNKLSQAIAEKEAELDNIREIGTKKAGVDHDYVCGLRHRHLTYQREYNTILEQHPSLANHYSKIIIDTFKDSWLEKKEYQMLEPVEIDLQKRLAKKRSAFELYLTAKIGENEQYEVYSIDGSFIRVEKGTDTAVYLGEGCVPSYVKKDESGTSFVSDKERIAAVLYKNWVYWYESGSILSDKFIYRRSLDGQHSEKLDWLSNEKTFEAMGHSVHNVSEDKVHRMLLKSSSLIIEVFRITQNATYQIIVSEDSGILNVERIFPWQTIYDKKTTSEDILQRQSNKLVSHRIESDLVKNPFYVLEVAPADKRAIIISKAEEKAFFLEGNACEEAQASLLNPSKRLSAELDWFCGCNESTVSNIRQSIKNNTAISTNELTGLAKLNATLFNFAISSYDDYFELGYAILDIDEQYDDVTPFELMETINECHSQAGILTVSEEDVERELGKKREQIRKLISAKTQNLSEEDYIEFITMLAEKCIADEDYEDGVVIADVVDQYELKMQSAIETATDEITNHLERIKRIANKEGIEANISGLVRRLKKWDKLVQPLQLKSMASGATHQVSDRVGYDVRALCLWLHNEQEMTEVALSLVNTLKEIFAEIGNLSDVFTSDSNALSRILREDEDSKEIIAGIEAVERIIEKWKGPDESTNSYMLATNAITDNIVNDLIAKVKALNVRIKAINADEETITQLRTALCITTREGAIYAHNERHKTALALSIAKTLLAEFGDMEELRGKLSEDVSALNRQLIALNASRSTYTPSYQPTRSNSSGSSKKGWIIAAIVFAIIIIIAIASGNDDASNRGQSSGNKPSYNQSSEVRFSSSVSAGTDVYADIVSIFPAIGIYTEGSSYYTHFVCECETSSGSTVWVYMSTSEYKKHFDSDASTSIFSSSAEKITFSYSKRFHGEARKADNVMSGLSSDTGATMLIDFESVGS